MKLTIVSPERKVLERAEAEEVVLSTTEGEIQILPGHAPLIGGIEAGALRFRLKDGRADSGVVSFGFFDIRTSPAGSDYSGEEVVITTETFEYSGDIDLERARKAQKTAESALQDSALDEDRFRKYQLKLERALIRQQFAGRSGGSTNDSAH